MEKSEIPSSSEGLPPPSSLDQTSDPAENHELNEQTRYVPRGKVITVRTSLSFF